MKTKQFVRAFAFAGALLCADQALASVTVTGATGGATISADTAATAPSPAWTTLGAITIAEGSAADFAVGTNTTLILKSPAGFEFNTAITPSITYTASRNITGASVAITDSSSITVTLTNSGTSALDTLTIGSTTGIQVRPTAATPLAAGNHIYRPSTGGGSETVTSITNSADGSSGSNFGNLTELGGAVTQLAFSVQPASATAGAVFGTQPAIVARDQFGNNATNALPATLTVTVTLTSGAGTLQGTTTTNIGMAGGKGAATYTNLRNDVAGSDKQLTASASGLTSASSSIFTVNPAVASKLVISTQPSSTATAGIAFVQQPVIYIEDTYNNVRSSDTLVVTATRSAGAGTLLGSTNVAATSGVVTFTNLAHPQATNITIAFTSGALTTTTSTVVAVSPDVFSKFLVLLPGETAAPGTATGRTGTPTARTAGTAFNVTVNAVDANWNLVTNVTDTVGITSSDATALLPANAALINSTNSFSITIKDAGSQTVSANDVTTGTATGTSSALTVNPAAFAKLQLLMPGETATPGTSTGKTGTPSDEVAGTAYALTVNAVDANWNVINTNDTIKIYSSEANAGLPANAALVTGTKAFTVTNKTVGTWTMTASNVTHSTIPVSVSPSFAVTTGAFAKLQILVPGETAAPGTATGKTGTPSAQTAGAPFSVTVNAVDANWNLINTVTDTVHFTSTDANAELPADTALSNGTGSFSATLNTTGTRTITASDATDGTKTANTSASITVTVAAFSQLQILMPGETAAPGTPTGKTSTPTAQTAGTAFSVTVRAVDANWNLVSTNDTVAITSSDTNATLPASAALSAGTKTFSVTFKTAGSETVTASDVTHATITANTGTATTVNPAVASKLVISTQPSSTATAGIAFVQQPVIYIEDTYNNVRSSDTLVVTATRSAGAGTLLGSTNVAATSGVVTFTNLAHPQATNITIAFTSGALTTTTSSVVAVSPDVFSKFQVLLPGETAAPGTATGRTGTVTAQTAGTAFSVKVNAVDANWNRVTNVTDTVAISSSDTNAVLPANAALINSTNSFSITIKDAGSQTVTANDITDGLTTGTSSAFIVNPAAFAKLQLLMPGETTAPGTSTGKTGTPSDEVAGTAYTLTVNAVDANWNLISTNDTIKIYSSEANAGLPANAALVTGTKAFTVTNKTVGTWTMTASNVTHSTIAMSVSPSFAVNVGAFTKLQLLVPGETTAPGTSTGKSGTPTPQSSGAAFNVTVNAVDANWNLINTVSDTVHFTSTDASAGLPADAALSSGTQTFSVELNTAGTRTITASDATDGTKTANTSPSITVTVAAFAQLQVLMPGETAAPGTPTGKTGTPTAQTAGTAFSATVRAVDANWNLISTNDTVHITSSDAAATLPANAALSSGSGTFSVTFKTTSSQTVTASDVTHPTITANTGAAATVNVGTFNKLQVLMPGETAAPGTTTGKTGTATAQTASTAFNVTVNAVDANWNLITTNDTVHITSSDANAVLPANAALVAGTQSFSVTLKTAGSQTVTASDVTHTGITANTGSSTTVNAGAFTKLQLLMPGETASPGTTTGKTGTPSARTAGTGFNLTVNAVDDNWNLVNTISDTVGITSSDANAVLPLAAPLSGGTRTFSVAFHTVGSQTVTASDVTDGGKTANTSPATTVNSGAVDHYVLAVSSPHNVGVPFTTTVTAQDSFNNTVTTNTATVTLTGTGSVQFDSNGDDVYGDNTKALTSGVLTIATKDNLAETVDITATANSKTGTLTGVAITPATGAYRSVTSGDWNSSATWETYDGSSWVAATVPPASTNAPTITIQSNTTVTVTADVTAGGLIVQSTGQITVGSGQTLTIPNGTGTDLDVAGTVSVLGTLAISSAADLQIEAGGSVAVNAGGILKNSGAVTSSASTLAFNSGATYQHNYTTTAGTIPTATWNTNSTCAIIGYTSDTAAPGGLGQAFANFTWGCTNQQSGTFNLTGTLTTVNGDFTVNTTGSGELRLGSSESGNLRVGGSFSQKGGTFRLSGDAGRTVTVVGNFSLSGGTFDINAGSLLAFNTVTLNVGGNFSPTAGTFTETGSVVFNTANMAFNGAGLQTYTSGATIGGTVDFTVNSGSTLVMGASTLTGGGTFTLSNGAGLQIGSAAGITASGATGNIQATGTRTFNTGANYTYSGTAAQATGNGLPATVNNLTITNSAGVTLSASATVNGTLTLTNGVLITGANQITIAATASIAGGSLSSYVNGNLQKAFNTGAGQSFTFPIGDASSYTPVSLASMNVGTAGNLTAKTTAGEHPNISTSGINSALDVNRYWTLTPGGSFAATGNVTFNYLATNVDGGATASQFAARRFSSSVWSITAVSGTPTPTAMTISGVSAFGDFAVGDQLIDHYVIATSSPQSAGVAFTTTVTAQDRLNQAVSDSSTLVTMTGTGSVEFDSNGDGTFGDNTKTLSGGIFTISTRDTVGETTTITATGGGVTTTSSPISISNSGQTITFEPLPNKTYGDAPFVLSATASSGLPVSFGILSGPATLAGSTLTITGAGTVTVRASQPGDGNWGPAPNVDRSFNVAQVPLTLYNFSYADRAALLADGWSFMAVNPDGTPRNTEITDTNIGAVVSYAQTNDSLGIVTRIPCDVGYLWGFTAPVPDAVPVMSPDAAANSTRNSLFRSLPTNWVSLQLSFSFPAMEDYQEVALVLYQDDDNYVDVAFQHNTGTADLLGLIGPNIVSLDHEFYGFPDVVAAVDLAATNVVLRLDRDTATDDVSAYCSQDGTNWVFVGQCSQALTNAQLGITVDGSTSTFPLENLPNCDLSQAVIITSDTYTPPARTLVLQPRHQVFNSVQDQPCTVTQRVNVVVSHSTDPAAWTVSSDSTWLSASMASGQAPGFCDVSVNTAGLTPGIHQGSLSFAATGLSNSPAPLSVTLIVNPNTRARVSTWKGAKAGAMTMTADDSSPWGFDMLNTNGLAGTFLMWHLGAPSFYTDYYQAGMELGAHTVDHACFHMTEPALRYEIESNILSLVTSSPVSQSEVISFAWPCGFVSPEAEAVAADYFLVARGYNMNQLEDTTPYDFMNVKCFNSHEHTPYPPDDFKTIVDAAIAQGKWYNLVLHVANDDDGAIGYAATQNIWVAPLGSVTKYIQQRDRTVITNYAESSSLIQFDCYRLPLDPSNLRSFETAVGTNDTLTFQVDVTDIPRVLGLSINGAGTTYTNHVINGRTVLCFDTPVTTNAQTIAISVSQYYLMTVTADSTSRVYGAPDPVFRGTVDGMQTSDGITVAFVSTANTTSPVGNYSIVPAFYDPNNRLTNYIITTNTGTLAITPAPMTVTANAQTKVYGANDPALTYQITAGALVGSDTLSGSLARATGETVGAYQINQGSLNATANYTLSFVPANLTVTVRPLTVSADNKSRAYGAANPELTAHYSGFAAGDDQSVLSGSPALSTDAIQSSAADSYPINVSQGSLSAANYSFSFVNGNMTVGKASLSVRAEDLSRGYGQTNPVLAVTYTGFVNSDTSAVLTGAPELSCNADTNSSVAGSPYSISITNGSLSAVNYEFAFVDGSLTVTQAFLTVTADSMGKLYGAALPTFTAHYTGFMNGEDTNVLSGAPALSTSATQASTVIGSPYPINVSTGSLSAANYEFAFIDGQLNIVTAALTGSVTVQNKVYDGATAATIATRNLDGIIGSDDVSLVGGSASFADKNVGTAKPVSVTGLSLSGSAAANYALASDSATASADITTRALTVSAVADSRTYDGSTAASVTLSDDRLSGDVLNLSYTSASFADKNAGTAKPVTVSGISLSGIDAANYSHNTSATASADISVRALTVSAVADSKTYDGSTASTQTPAITLGSVASGDTAAFVQSFDNKNAGSGKTLTPTGSVNDGNSGNNYSLTFSPVTTGIILPANLTVSADNAARSYGLPNPEFTAQYSGFVGGDTQSVLSGTPDLATTATQSSAPGTYPISASVGTLSAQNYTFNFVDGTLTIGNPTQLRSLGVSAGQYVFSFPTLQGQSYQVEHSADLQTWTPVGNPVIGTGEVITVTNAVSGPRGFFRLNIQL